ncbi:DNA topoisomerase III [Anaeropeptidivorans aminofermentans]|uniref:DNA topoisomerase III n=1 Tax=Anaeropeptidivorans aminofermentans TaxID=2934315 RepID=UPI00202529A1|nr:DNA topoisomerase III [Anaeropeptidivorans aminofermentans]
MGKILIIAEKPSVAQDIAKVLNAKVKGDGFFSSDEYIVTWALGHLVSLAEPEDYDEKYKKWKIADLPIMPEKIKLKSAPKTQKQLNILKKLMNSEDTESIICATDSGREGELIFRYIYEFTKCRKPFKRLWISSMTDAAIKKGFQDIKPGSDYDNLYYSAKCRSEADWLVGINASRAYSLKYNSLLSIGRVQTPTLAIITSRQEEIDAFVPQDYWQIKAQFGEYIGLWSTEDLKDNKLFDLEKANEIISKLQSKTGTVKDIIKEKKSQPPGLLYDLTLLQREANRKFGYSAKDTLSIAQDLYEKRKLITYPRTDSQYLSDDMVPKLKTVIEKLNMEPYGDYVHYVLSLPKLPITKRIVDNKKISDHHAIIPTEKQANLKALSSGEYNIYDLIVRKFLAAFYPNYIYNVTKIITLSEEETFVTQGNTVIQLGFRELYKDDKKPAKEEEEAILPDVKIGEEFPVLHTELISKKTTPPKLYTEESLLAAMENAGRFVDDETLKEKLKESGIGTPATRAAIIERLISVGYLTRSGKNLIPTEKGMNLIKTVPHELKSPETTGKWEKGLTSIAKGNMDSRKFMDSIGRYVKYIIDCSKSSSAAVHFPKDEKKTKKYPSKSFGDCPLCKEGKVLENTKAFYCSRWKEGCKFTLWKSILDRYGLKLDEKIITEALHKRKIEGIKIVMPQTGEECTADLVLDMEKNPYLQIVNVNRINSEKQKTRDS